MDQSGEIISEPLDSSGRGVLWAKARFWPPARLGRVEYFLERRKHKPHWAGRLLGSVSSCERVEVPCRGQAASGDGCVSGLSAGMHTRACMGSRGTEGKEPRTMPPGL